MAEEAMKPAPVSVTDIASREDDLGDIAVTMNEKVWRVGAVKTGEKCCSRATNESVSSTGRFPCCGNVSRSYDHYRLPKTRKEADVFF
jgi:hypothetical protein